MLLVGTHEHAIDAKQRLAIPSKFREELTAAGATELYAVVRGGVLCLYTREGYEKRANALERAGKPADFVLSYEQHFYAETERLIFDKQGRVRIPDTMLDEAGLAKLVTVVGVRDHLQVHDAQRWRQNRQEARQRLPDLLQDPRQMSWPSRTPGPANDAG
ncbi:MAG: hypothetical protein GC162_10555 [Planctomycetes bacterium]|nr:hypothetical protein [Planctomycetota bacterium]